MCSYLKHTKISFFFSFKKLENRRAEQFLSGDTGTSGRGKEMEKECESVNIA
jgi:hypothetical protein